MNIRSAITCCLLAWACLLCGPLSAGAANKPPAQPSAATLAQAQDLARLVGMDKVMRGLSGQAVLPLVRQVMASDPRFTPQDLEHMSRAWQETVWQDLEPELVTEAAKVYARHLSAHEIAQALAFFKSPAGRKLVAAQPGITQESQQAAQEVVKSWLKRINADPKLREDFFKRVGEKLPPELREKAEKP